jgi:hypothetical protein
MGCGVFPYLDPVVPPQRSLEPANEPPLASQILEQPGFMLPAHQQRHDPKGPAQGDRLGRILTCLALDIVSESLPLSVVVSLSKSSRIGTTNFGS